MDIRIARVKTQSLLLIVIGTAVLLAFALIVWSGWLVAGPDIAARVLMVFIGGVGLLTGAMILFIPLALGRFARHHLTVKPGGIQRDSHFGPFAASFRRQLSPGEVVVVASTRGPHEIVAIGPDATAFDGAAHVPVVPGAIYSDAEAQWFAAILRAAMSGGLPPA